MSSRVLSYAARYGKRLPKAFSSMTRKHPLLASRSLAGMIGSGTLYGGLHVGRVYTEEEQMNKARAEGKGEGEGEDDIPHTSQSLANLPLPPPNMINIVADNIAQIALDKQQDVVVYKFSEYCPRCCILKVVVEQIAEVMKDTNVVFAIYNGDENYEKECFSREEYNLNPTVMLFSAGNNSRCELTDDIPNATAQEIVKKLHQHVNQSFDLDKVLKGLDDRKETITDKIMDAAEGYQETTCKAALKEAKESRSKSTASYYYSSCDNSNPCLSLERLQFASFTAAPFIPMTSEEKEEMFFGVVLPQVIKCKQSKEYEAYLKTAYKHFKSELSLVNDLNGRDKKNKHKQKSQESKDPSDDQTKDIR